MNIWGSGYVPSLVGTDTRAVIVDENGILSFEDIVEIETKREGQTVAMVSADLETAYPDAPDGFEVVCKNITGGGKIYKKLDATGNWGSYDLTTV